MVYPEKESLISLEDLKEIEHVEKIITLAKGEHRQVRGRRSKLNSLILYLISILLNMIPYSILFSNFL